MPPSKIRIAMIPSGPDGVNYYRMAAWAFEMRKYKNVIVDLLWFGYETNPYVLETWQEDFRSDKPHVFPGGKPSGYTMHQYRRATIEKACELADIVVWHPMSYEWSLEFFLEMQHKYQKPFVVECDDNLVDVPVWNEGFHSYRNGEAPRAIALDSMRNADAMTVTTPHLGQTYASVNDNIYLLPNSLDFKGDRKFIGWDRVSVRKHKGTRIGWIGGRCHFNDLMIVAPVLREILERNPEVTLVLVNSALQKSCKVLGKPYPFEGLNNVHYADRSVAINRYAQFAASFGFDIGLAPLVDCNFNRSKSNLRWLEYSAMRIPCVATDISNYSETVKTGQTGMLVPNNDLGTWRSCIQTLIDDKSARETIGRNAYREVKTHFNVLNNAPAYLRLLKKLANVGSIFVDDREEVAV